LFQCKLAYSHQIYLVYFSNQSEKLTHNVKLLFLAFKEIEN